MKQPSTGWVAFSIFQPFPITTSSEKTRHDREVLTSKRHQQARVCRGTGISGYDRYTVRAWVQSSRYQLGCHETARQRIDNGECRTYYYSIHGNMVAARLECWAGGIHKKNTTKGTRGSRTFSLCSGPSPVVSTRNTAGRNTAGHVDGGARGDTMARVQRRRRCPCPHPYSAPASWIARGPAADFWML